MAEKRIIHIKIAGKKYPVRVNKDSENEEEVLRISEQLINKRMNDYQKIFYGNDKFDILVMTCLDICKELVKVDAERIQVSDSELFNKLNIELDKLLEE